MIGRHLTGLKSVTHNCDCDAIFSFSFFEGALWFTSQAFTLVLMLPPISCCRIRKNQPKLTVGCKRHSELPRTEWKPMGRSVPQKSSPRMSNDETSSHVTRSLLVALLLLSCVAIPTTQGYRIFEDRQRPDNSTDRPFPPLGTLDYAFQLMPFNASDLIPYAGVYFSDPSQLSDSVPILASPLSPYKFWRESGNQWKFGTYPSAALWTCECSFDYPPPTNWKRVGASPSICAITNPSAGDVYTTMTTESSMNITWISTSLGKYPHAVTITLINSDTSAVLATIATAVTDVGYYVWTGTGLFASYASTYNLAIKVSSTSLAVSATSGTFGVASTVASASRINGPEAELKRLDAEVLVSSPSYCPFAFVSSSTTLVTGYYSLYTVADLVASGVQVSDAVLCYLCLLLFWFFFFVFFTQRRF